MNTRDRGPTTGLKMVKAAALSDQAAGKADAPRTGRRTQDTPQARQSSCADRVASASPGERHDPCRLEGHPFEAVAAQVVSPEAGRHGARLDDLRHGLRGDRVLPIRGRAGGSPGPTGRGRAGNQILRNTGPSVRPATCCHSSRARTGQSSASASVCSPRFAAG